MWAHTCIHTYVHTTPYTETFCSTSLVLDCFLLIWLTNASFKTQFKDVSSRKFLWWPSLDFLWAWVASCEYFYECSDHILLTYPAYTSFLPTWSSSRASTMPSSFVCFCTSYQGILVELNWTIASAAQIRNLWIILNFLLLYSYIQLVNWS